MTSQRTLARPTARFAVLLAACLAFLMPRPAQAATLPADPGLPRERRAVAPSLPRALAPQAAGAWVEEPDGRWWYHFASGGWPAASWEWIDWGWFWFDSAGWMRTGWQYVWGNWFHLGPSGAMDTGWLNDAGTWYYLGQDGWMRRDWTREGDAWYYLHPSGAMATGRLDLDGATYLFGDNGVMQTGWAWDNGAWYYFGSDGALVRSGVAADGAHTDAQGRWLAEAPAPATPATSATPDFPATPSAPASPETQATPETPSVPDTPATAEAPSTPATPATPPTPEAAESPSTPETPATPDTPEAPATPTSAATPATPDDPGKSALQRSVDAYLTTLNAQVADDAYADGTVLDASELPVPFDGDAPALGWVEFKDGAVAEYEFYFADTYLLKTAHQVVERPYDPAKLLNVRSCGATGDGTADDSAAIASALKQLGEQGGGILYFPRGTYRVTSSSNGEGAITVRGSEHVELDFMKSTVLLNANAMQAYAVVRATGCADVSMRNGILKGDRLSHDYETLKSTHEWGHGINVNDCTACEIVNMDVSDAAGDAIYVRNYGEGTTTIRDCDLHHSRRQGLSITACDNVEVYDTHIHDIGTSDGVPGTAPQCGIDLEPNDNEHKIANVLLDNVYVHDNTNLGLVNENKYSASVLNVVVQNSTIERLDTTSGTHIKNCRLIYPKDTTELIKGGSIEGSHITKVGKLSLRYVTVDGCVFEGRDLNDESGSGASMKVVPKDALVTNCTFRNVQGYGNYQTGSLGNTGISFADYSNDSYGYREGSGHNTYEGCSLVINNLTETNSTFKGCHVFKSDAVDALTVRDNTFEDCVIRTQPKPITLSGCTVVRPTFTVPNNGELRLEGGSLTLESAEGQDAFPKNVVASGTTVRVLGAVVPNAFANVRFEVGSRLVLERYASAALNVPKSSEGADYTLELRGTEAL